MVAIRLRTTCPNFFLGCFWRRPNFVNRFNSNRYRGCVRHGKRGNGLPFMIEADGVNHMFAGLDRKCRRKVPCEIMLVLRYYRLEAIRSLYLKRDGSITPTIPVFKRVLCALGFVCQNDVESAGRGLCYGNSAPNWLILTYSWND